MQPPVRNRAGEGACEHRRKGLENKAPHALQKNGEEGGTIFPSPHAVVIKKKLQQGREGSEERSSVAAGWPRRDSAGSSRRRALRARPALTKAGAADEGGGGERPGRRAVHLPGVGDEEGGMFLQAAGYSDVVDPQEAAAGEGDIPGGVRGEHGLRAPLETGTRGEEAAATGRGNRGAPLTSHHPWAGRTKDENRGALLPKTVTDTPGFAAGLPAAAAELI